MCLDLGVPSRDGAEVRKVVKLIPSFRSVFGALTWCGGPLMIIQASEGGSQDSLELLQRALDGILHDPGMLICRNGLMPGWAGLDHAADVILAALMAVDVAEVDLDPSDSLGETVETRPDHVLDGLG
jgi:hypothetical protein